MAKGQHLSSHQKGIVKRYYKNKDTIATQKLGELVSELYLAENEKKADRLWKRIETALNNAGANPARVRKLLEDRDVNKLAEYVNDLF